MTTSVRPDVPSTAAPTATAVAPGRPEARRWGAVSRRVRAWTLWTNRPALLAYVLAVDAAAVVVAVVAYLGSATSTTLGAATPTLRDAAVFGLLAVGSAVHGEITRRVEQAREIAADHVGYVDPHSVWTFAGLLLLPLWQALALVVLVYTYTWMRVNARPPLHRRLFTAATMVLGHAAAALCLAPVAARLARHGGFDGTGVVLAASGAAVQVVVNLGLVVGVISLAAPATSWRERIGRRDDHAVELGSLGLGVALAVLATTSPCLVPVLLAPMFTMHRGALFTRLVQSVRTDDKTGLASSAFWHAEATRLVARARRRGTAASVLMVDLDHFKKVNDTYGHVTGDRVLRAVADALVPAVRAEDLVGRFGGEEFVVLLRDADAATAAATAERLRRQVGAVSVPAASLPSSTDEPVTVSGLSVSIGVATCAPGAGPTTLDDLVLAADGALYGAKRAGRDRVVSAD